MDITGTDFHGLGQQYEDAFKSKEKDVELILNRLGRHMVKILKNETPVNRGKLRDSTEYELSEPVYTNEVDSSVPVRVWNLVIKQTQKSYRYGTQKFGGSLGVQKDTYYGDILQVGAKPHYPPFIQIMQWAGKKFGYNIGRFNTYLGQSRPRPTGWNPTAAGARHQPIKLSKAEKKQLQHIRTIAFGVIQAKGVKKNPYDEEALSKSLPAIQHAINQIQGSVISELTHEKKSHMSYVQTAEHSVK